VQVNATRRASRRNRLSAKCRCRSGASGAVATSEERVSQHSCRNDDGPWPRPAGASSLSAASVATTRMPTLLLSLTAMARRMERCSLPIEHRIGLRPIAGRARVALGDICQWCKCVAMRSSNRPRVASRNNQADWSGFRELTCQSVPRDVRVKAADTR
jgi:hypothetical protein